MIAAIGTAVRRSRSGSRSRRAETGSVDLVEQHYSVFSTTTPGYLVTTEEHSIPKEKSLDRDRMGRGRLETVPRAQSKNTRTLQAHNEKKFIWNLPPGRKTLAEQSLPPLLESQENTAGKPLPTRPAATGEHPKHARCTVSHKDEKAAIRVLFCPCPARGGIARSPCQITALTLATKIGCLYINDRVPASPLEWTSRGKQKNGENRNISTVISVCED